MFRKSNKDEDLGRTPEQPSNPKPSAPTTTDDKETWVAMAVPVEQISGFSKLRGTLLTPRELAKIRQQLNDVLKKDGFEIEVTYHQALGVLADQLNYVTLNREVLPLPYIAVWRHVDVLFRKKLQLDTRVEYSPPQAAELKKHVQHYINSVVAKRQQQQQEELAQLGVPPVSMTEQPMAAQTIVELIQWEAEVQARRHEKIPKDQTVLPDILEKYVQMAWGRYNQLHSQWRK